MQYANKYIDVGFYCVIIHFSLYTRIFEKGQILTSSYHCVFRINLA